MLGEILWQVKPNGQTPPLTEDLQLGWASKASLEEGVNVTNAPVIGAQSQEQKDEEQIEELADNPGESGQNILAPQPHCCRHDLRCCTLKQVMRLCSTLHRSVGCCSQAILQ